MTYQQTETSTQSGAPIECYRFVGSFQTYRYTSYQEQVVVNGETYLPIAIKRNNVKISSQEENQLAIELTLPYQEDVVRDYAYNEAPPSLTCEIIRAHDNNLNDTVTLWIGNVTGFTVENFTAKLRVPSVFDSLLTGAVPQPRYQAPCNHVFTDARCGIDAASVSETVTVQSVVGNLLVVSGLSFSSDQLLIGRVDTTGEESRMITGVDGNQLTVTYPFSNLQAGELVTVSRGCDHSFGTCANVYNNGRNFGGFPLVPNRNPFTGKI